MNLHEIYEMLMRRGMPKHQEIRYDGYTGDGDVPSWGDGSVWGFYDGDEPLMACSEQQARDLITMHALRWALGRLDSETARNAAYLEVFSDGSCVIERGGEVLGESDRDILAAILAATECLEPKGDDDAKRP